MSTDTMTTTQVNRVFIKATPEAIWNAITQPEWSDRYGYGGKVDYDLRPGGAYKAYASEAMKQAGAAGGFPVPDVVVDGEVIEADPPHAAGHDVPHADGPRGGPGGLHPPDL